MDILFTVDCVSIYEYLPGSSMILIKVSETVFYTLKVHKIEIFLGFNFEMCIISLLVMSKY
jgi:hypothetical protein